MSLLEGLKKLIAEQEKGESSEDKDKSEDKSEDKDSQAEELASLRKQVEEYKLKEKAATVEDSLDKSREPDREARAKQLESENAKLKALVGVQLPKDQKLEDSLKHVAVKDDGEAVYTGPTAQGDAPGTGKPDPDKPALLVPPGDGKGSL